MHSAAPMILSSNLYFTLFHDKQYLSQPPRRKMQRNQICRMKLPVNGFPFSYQAIRKLPAQKGTNTTEWGGAPLNYKTGPTEKWHKAVISITARKVSPVTIGSSKKKGDHNFICHQSAPHTDLTCSVTAQGFSFPHRWQMCLLSEMLLHQRNTCA